MQRVIISDCPEKLVSGHNKTCPICKGMGQVSHTFEDYQTGGNFLVFLTKINFEKAFKRLIQLGTKITPEVIDSYTDKLNLISHKLTKWNKNNLFYWKISPRSKLLEFDLQIISNEKDFTISLIKRG